MLLVKSNCHFILRVDLERRQFVIKARTTHVSLCQSDQGYLGLRKSRTVLVENKESIIIIISCIYKQNDRETNETFQI